jgi:leukotriene-A4 hydrolase
MDANSTSNYHQIRLQSYHFNWKPDFYKLIMTGDVTMTCSVIKQTKSIDLDIRDLIIDRCLLDNKECEHHITNITKLGSTLQIVLRNGDVGSEFSVQIFYRTTPNGEALQWLNPEQTVGKKHHYLFSQCQAIHARSLFPCFDTPGTKATYRACVTVPKPLVAVMSAISTGHTIEEETIIYTFAQKVPIPSYLVAIAVGDLEKRSIGPRSHVWSEPCMLDKAEYEFSETEDFIKAAESFLPAYGWGTYDLLLLPGSFPYGGMENANLTFVTPTLLAGDRSLADVVAHEISHSWAGNLVSNASWEHFWLNEGFTVYIERRILARMISEEYAQFHALMGLKNLEEDISHYVNNHFEYTALVPDLKGVDPDDSFSKVPYEKGFNFLYYLTGLVGGYEFFEKFLFAYFTEFRFKSLTSDDFKQFFLKYFHDCKRLNEIDWELWFKKPGMPLKNEFDTTIATKSVKLAKLWLIDGGKDKSTDDISGWSTLQILYFLEQLGDVDKLDHKVLEVLDSIYHLSKRNAEITFKYQMIALKSSYESIIPHVIEFVESQGRMKFVRPLYRSLGKLDHDIATKTFEKNKYRYHGIAQKMIAIDLEKK